MERRKFILAVFSLLVFMASAIAQEIPKREFRATWLATVGGGDGRSIDWPKSKVASVQKTEMISILDRLEEANMTSVLFQVRPMADAFYKSKYEPWSHYLTGKRGQDPGYDPLVFTIEEAHKRGIEVHAWLNPYRYESGSINHGTEDNIRKNHPKWLLTYSDRKILDPGNPEVRQYIVNIVADLVENYNLDGIIFDDYYYPYSGTTNQDAYSQNLYKDPSMDVGDWRRQNVNVLIAEIYSSIQAIKPTVKFSQGPFGIWGASPSVAAEYGIDYLNTSGGTNAYTTIYCDGVKWLKDKIIDFITPQCYWPSTNKNMWGYTTLVPWWSKVAGTMDRHFYSSMRMSTMGTRSTKSSADVSSVKFEGLSNLEIAMLSSGTPSLKSAATDECDYEIDLNRSANVQDAPGHVFFNTLAFFNAGFHTHLRATKFALPALPPVMKWKTPTTLAALSNVKIQGDNLVWTGDTKESDRFAIYLVPNGEVNNNESYEKSLYLKKVTWSKQLDISQYKSMFATHTFAVTVIDGHGYESAPFLQENLNSISDEVVNNSIITGGVGCIDIKTDRPIKFEIFSILGHRITAIIVSEEASIPVNAGVYVVNGQKVVVK